MIVNNSPQMDVLPTAATNGLRRPLPRRRADRHRAVGHPRLRRRHPPRAESGLSERAAVDAVIRIDGQRDRNLLVNLAVTTPRRDTIFFQASRFRVPASGIGTVTIPIELESPTLWNGVENPYLYNVIVKVTDQNVTCDSLAVPLGLRYFSVDPKTGFALNGRPLQLHGVFYYEDRASVGPALTEYQIREDLDYMVEMGVNAVRTSPGPHSQEFYDECDRRGLIVWSDLPFVGPSYLTDRGYIGTESSPRQRRAATPRDDLAILQPPSIAMWGLFSNQSMRWRRPHPVHQGAEHGGPGGGSHAHDRRREQPGRTDELHHEAGRLGPHLRLERGPSLRYFGMAGNSCRPTGATSTPGLSYGAGASIYHQDDSLYRPDYLGNWHPERWQSYLHEQYYSFAKNAPFLWGVFIANMFDYGAAGREWGDGTGVDDRGLVTFDRKYRKDAFYFYKANWNPDEPFVYIAERRWDRCVKRTQTLKVYSNAPKSKCC
ncbi:MAG: glycoside hydrolase family 2 TIM barrel-domain containing protein [Alistipes indistinctus]